MFIVACTVMGRSVYYTGFSWSSKRGDALKFDYKTEATRAMDRVVTPVLGSKLRVEPVVGGEG